MNKVKIKHVVYVNGTVFEEFHSLMEAERMAKELEYRRSGRSYKKLFEALSRSDDVIILVYPSESIASLHKHNFTSILKSLNFMYTEHPHSHIVYNSNRIFKFTSHQNYNSPHFNSGDNAYVLMDLT